MCRWVISIVNPWSRSLPWPARQERQPYRFVFFLQEVDWAHWVEFLRAMVVLRAVEAHKLSESQGRMATWHNGDPLLGLCLSASLCRFPSGLPR